MIGIMSMTHKMKLHLFDMLPHYKMFLSSESEACLGSWKLSIFLFLMKFAVECKE